MQLIEVTELGGVRSAVIAMRHRDTPLRFVLFPMVHLGEAAFYESVAERLRSCELVVAEGVQGRSARVRALTRSYRWLGRGRHDLVVQHIDYRALGTPVIVPDMTGAEFDRRWRDVPLRTRVLVWLLIPPYTLGLLVFSDRRFLSRRLELDYEPTEEELRAREDYSAFYDLLLDRRDELLLDALVSIHRERRTEPVDVAVVYGAGHMRAVIRGLRTLGYQPRSLHWLTVFDL